MRAKYRPKLVFQWAIFAVLVAIVWALHDSRTMLFISVLLAYLCHPLLLLIEKRGAPRWLATAIVFVLVFSPLVILAVIGTPFLITNIISFVHAFPEWLSVTMQKVDVFAKSWGVELPVKHQEIMDMVNERMQQMSMEMVTSATDVVRKSVTTFTGVLLTILDIVLMPVVFIYLLNDFESWRDSLNDLTPIHLRPTSRRLAGRMHVIVGSYFRGQLLASLLLGILYGTGLQLVGLPFGWLIGGLTGFFSFVPYVGFTTGFLVAMITAIASGIDGVGIGEVVGVLAVVQIIENSVVIPRLVGKFVGLNPVEALLSLIVCGNLFGFPGLLLAIPLGALFKEAFQELRRQAGV